MNIQLQDKTIASFRLVQGQAKVTYHGLNDKSVILPKDFTLTIDKVNQLYLALKAKGENQ